MDKKQKRITSKFKKIQSNGRTNMFAKLILLSMGKTHLLLLILTFY